MAQLSNEEKISIINQHLRNLEFAEYNLELDLIEANAVNSPADVITDITNRKNSVVSKMEALEAEKASLAV